MKQIVRACLFGPIVGVCAGHVAAGVVLTEVDFEAPLHTLGAPPTIAFGGVPRRTPSRQAQTTVEAFIAGMPTAALSLAPEPGGSSLVSFWLGSGPDPRSGDPGLGTSFSTYRLDMDVVVVALVESPPLSDDPDFKIELEAPFAHQVRFTHDGAIRAITFDETGITESQIGTFTFGEPLHLRILAELAAQRWTIDLDGAPAFSGTFPNEGALWGINAVLNRPAMFAGAGLDNVHITGLPEPSVGAMLALGLWTFCRRRRKPDAGR